MKTKMSKIAALWERAKRYRKAVCIVLLVLVGVFGSLPLWQEEGIIAEDQLIRFHVIANSDSIADQDVKLLVRNAILDYINPMLNEATSEAEAYALITAHTGEIATIAETVLAKEGFPYGAEANLTTGKFPTKAYGELVLPAGTYQALRVELGEAEGKNWWCVLFPPLCYVNIAEGVAVATAKHSDLILDADEESLAADAGVQKTEIKFKLLELLDQ